MSEVLLACACGPHPSLLLALTVASLAITNSWPLTFVSWAGRAASSLLTAAPEANHG